MLIQNAYAQAAGAAPGGLSALTGQLPFLVAMVVLFYFLLIRPQQKRAKDQKTMIDSVKSGDELITSGGILGKVTRVADQYLVVEVAQAGSSPIELTIQKSAVQTVLPKGTLKSI